MACNNLGWMLERGRGSSRELAKARALYARACEGGLAVACKNLGRPPRGERQDALAAYGRGCVMGHARSCNNQGWLLGLSRTPEDEARARALYEQACEGGVGLACSNAATLAPPERARSLHARACALGVQDVCEMP